MFTLFHQHMKHPKFDIVSFCGAVPAATSILFLYCYFGKLATESFKKMAECLCECNWYDLSPEHQKYYIIMIQSAQQPLQYRGFGIAALDLETFTTVRKINDQFCSMPTHSMENIFSFTDDKSSLFVLYDLQNLNR